MKATKGTVRVILLVFGLGLFKTPIAAFDKDFQDHSKSVVEAVATDGEMETDIGPADVALWLFAVYATAEDTPVDFFQRAVEIGVGVERSAIGYDDHPLAELIDKMQALFGERIAAIVAQSFHKLIKSLGPKLVADVSPIVLPPEFDVNNGQPDAMTVLLPDGAYILDIGPTQNVGAGDLASVILGLLDSDGDDNDAEQILAEIITGSSGSNLDFERDPGIAGVRLRDIWLGGYTLELQDGAVVDQLTLSGPGVESILAKLNAPANISDVQNSLSFIEIGIDDVEVGSWFENPIRDLVGQHLSSWRDIKALIDAVFSGDDRIDLMGFDEKRISLVLHNERTGSADVLVLFGDVVEFAMFISPYVR